MKIFWIIGLLCTINNAQADDCKDDPRVINKCPGWKRFCTGKYETFMRTYCNGKGSALENMKPS